MWFTVYSDLIFNEVIFNLDNAFIIMQVHRKWFGHLYRKQTGHFTFLLYTVSDFKNVL